MEKDWIKRVTWLCRVNRVYDKVVDGQALGHWQCEFTSDLIVDIDILVSGLCFNYQVHILTIPIYRKRNVKIPCSSIKKVVPGCQLYGDTRFKLIANDK